MKILTSDASFRSSDRPADSSPLSNHMIAPRVLHVKSTSIHSKEPSPPVIPAGCLRHSPCVYVIPAKAGISLLHNLDSRAQEFPSDFVGLCRFPSMAGGGLSSQECGRSGVDSRLRGNDVGGCGSDVGARLSDQDLPCEFSALPRARVRASRAGTSFRCASSDFVGLCRFPSTAGWGIDDCGLQIGDWGLQDCLLGLWFRWSGHGSRIVRGFCFVKCDAGVDSRLRGNDVDTVGMTKGRG